jgi:multidrug efflux pump subunit AcrA (membrane-fusion protein)
MTKKRLIVISAIVLVVALVGVRIFWPKKAVVTYETAKPTRGTLTQTVQATGTVNSAEDVDLKFEAPGRVRSIKVKVGDAVKTGDLLAELDTRDAAVAVQQAQAGLLAAQSAYDKLQAGATSQDIAVTEAQVNGAESNLASSQQALADAKQALSDVQTANLTSLTKAYSDLSGTLETSYLKSSAAVQELSNDVYDASANLRTDFSPVDSVLAGQAASAFKDAKTVIGQMATDLAAARAASDSGTIDRAAAAIVAEAETVQTAAQLANAMMQSANPAGSLTQATLDLRKSSVQLSWSGMVAAVNAADAQRQLVDTTRAAAAQSQNAAQSRVNSASSAVTSAQASLDAASAALALKQAPATSYDLESAKANVAAATAAVNSAALALDHLRIKAPFAGTVAQVPGQVGTTVSSMDVILKLHGSGAYEVEADIPETDVAKLKVGMEGTAQLDAYGSDKIFPIKLTSIDTAETVIQDIVYYKTRFQLTMPDGEPVRAGMTANVNVIAAKKDNVLIVPQRSIRDLADGSGKGVRVLKQGSETIVPVTTGLKGDNGQIEIVSGLTGNEDVILTTKVGK